ncbi:hypothetical protein [Pseudomonas oryzihabitans]|uniref:hypothetical protein n=1 Tax=Pseudomonas oryzihabitans TaxID=47885 RepID=UPI0021DA720F|nr:hypothetical protein [Pseudomonas oryzihabitans]
MATRYEDKLSQILGDSIYNHRQDLWLWYKLNFCYHAFNERDLPSSGMREKIASYLQQNEWLIKKILMEKTKELIPEQELSWLTNERRLLEWTTEELKRIAGHNQMTHHIDLSGKDLAVTILDIWPTDLTEKISVMRNLEQKWLRHKAHDRKYAWFKDDDQKCHLAYEWLKKNTTFFMHRTPFDNYEDLLIFFDNANYSTEKEELYIGKIKKTWNQRKYRSSLQGKAQYNLVLSDKTIETLDKISTQYEISRARVIEILVEMEGKEGIYIAEKLKNTKLLREV